MDPVRANALKSNAVDWLFCILLLAVGVANLLLVHAVPALGYAVVSLVYLPPARAFLMHRFGISIHPVARVAMGIVIVMFTLGVSDLGEIID